MFTQLAVVSGCSRCRRWGEYWGNVKKFSGYLPKIVTGSGAVSGGAGTGVVGTGAVVTSSTISGGTVTTTVTIGGATGATAAAAVGAAGAVIGVGVGQGLGWVVSSFWDPTAPLQAWNEDLVLTGANDAEIDAFVSRVSPQLPAVFVDRSGGTEESVSVNPYTMRDIERLDEFYPGLGSALTRFIRVGIRGTVVGLQGAAAATISQPGVVEAAAEELDECIGDYVDALDDLQRVVRNPDLEPLFLTYSLSEYLWFVEDNSRRGVRALPVPETVLLQSLFDLSRTRWPEGDFREAVSGWIAEEPTTDELTVFEKEPNGTITFAQLLNDAIELGFEPVEITESPLLD